MVTPTALNGAGCAAAVPAISAEANNKAANIPVFTAASLELDCQLLAMRGPYQPLPNLSRAVGAKKQMDCKPILKNATVRLFGFTQDSAAVRHCRARGDHQCARGSQARS